MANDINDDAEMNPNHNEAWSLAHFKRGTSNLARAYIELRELARRARLGNLGPEEDARLSSIIHANDI
jgi:hypothetical protein